MPFLPSSIAFDQCPPPRHLRKNGTRTVPDRSAGASGLPCAGRSRPLGAPFLPCPSWGMGKGWREWSDNKSTGTTPSRIPGKRNELHPRLPEPPALPGGRGSCPGGPRWLSGPGGLPPVPYPFAASPARVPRGRLPPSLPRDAAMREPAYGTLEYTFSFWLESWRSPDPSDTTYNVARGFPAASNSTRPGDPFRSTRSTARFLAA